MQKRPQFAVVLAAVLSIVLTAAPRPAQAQNAQADQAAILAAMHTIASQPLYDYVRELASDKYSGRLTGTPEFDACAEWVAGLFKSFGLKPGGDNGTYFQNFPNPYTIILPGGDLAMHLPLKNSKDVIDKHYIFEDEWLPGGTSGSGEVTAEVVYVGYGVTAPELGYDDYKGLDVKGKIVLMEREVPVEPEKDAALFMKWRPYSFHGYKTDNAVAHGAKGMLYNYGPINNPNGSWHEGFVFCHVGDAVVRDVFAGTGKSYEDTVKAIAKTLKPHSFATGKIMTLKLNTVHHPEGLGKNVVAVAEGSDPVLKNEYIVLGGHLDHVGRAWKLNPGANDNAGSAAVELGVAQAMTKCVVKPKRSVMFILFGSEEQGVAGSNFYVNQSPIVPLDKTVCFINMDGVASGDKFGAIVGQDCLSVVSFLKAANDRYIHRQFDPFPFANLARPRLDMCWFLWKGVPALTLVTEGFPLTRPSYHNSYDNMDLVTPEIMEDMAKMLFVGIMDIGRSEKADFRK